MNTKQISKRGLMLAIMCAVLLAGILSGCSDSPDAAEAASKYTEETARAIIDGSWKIAGSLLLGLVINGFLSS